jgi:ABC-type microcin C transport system permease subunit YejE
MILTRKEAIVLMLLALVGLITLLTLLVLAGKAVYADYDQRMHQYYYNNPARG